MTSTRSTGRMNRRTNPATAVPADCYGLIRIFFRTKKSVKCKAAPALPSSCAPSSTNTSPCPSQTSNNMPVLKSSSSSSTPSPLKQAGQPKPNQSFITGQTLHQTSVPSTSHKKPHTFHRESYHSDHISDPRMQSGSNVTVAAPPHNAAKSPLLPVQNTERCFDTGYKDSSLFYGSMSNRTPTQSYNREFSETVMLKGDLSPAQFEI